MITLAWYLLKVIICSGILCGYYYLALRNKIFHRWNRFYLLASVVLALIVPLMKFDVSQNSGEDKGTVVKMLQTISNSDEIIIEYSRHKGLELNSTNIISLIYLLITIAFLTIFFLSLYEIFRLKRNNPGTKMKGISFITTDAKGTPFSFFNSIFWNNAIDLHSQQGQQIFNHEIAHVKEKHSYDKIFMNVLLIFFWMNPFFWLMRKELIMIHEFIADKEALEDSDISVFAEMVLQTVYPGQQFSLTNNFFHSPIKRRLIMFTKNKNPKVNYLSRLLVLPLAAIVFFAFTLKMKTFHSVNNYVGKKITVVIDPGHGGSDNGAMENNINEKDLNLVIAKDIKELNKNENLNIILSRSDDKSIDPHQRIQFAEANKADLFVSIHMDAEENKNTHSGLSILVPKNDNPFLKESQTLGSAIIQSFQNNYQLPVTNDLQQPDHGVWILKANEFPAVLLEAGFLTTQKDLDYLTNPKNQITIAQNILNGIEKYAVQNLVYTIPEKDTIPAEYLKVNGLKNLAIYNNKDSVLLTYNDGRKEIITKEEMKKRDLLLPPPPPPPPPPKPTLKFKQNALYVLDGEISSYDEIIKIKPELIGKIYVLKGSVAYNIYGDKGRYGVIEVIINSKSSPDENVLNNKVSPQSQNNALNTNFSTIAPEPIYFVDGKESSKNEINIISSSSIESISVLKGKDAISLYGEKAKNGVVLITRKNENVNKSVTLNTNANNTANSIYFSNGKNTNASEKNTIELNDNTNKTGIDTIPDKVFTKVENEASFPGGHEAWIKYIITKIQASIDSFTNKDYGTCLVRFIVNTDGSISNVEATTMKDTHLAEIAMNAIRTGPKWIPATQNGREVAAYRLQPVTLSNPDKK